MNVKKKSKKIFWIIFISTVLLVFLIGFGFSLFSEKKTETKNEATVSDILRKISEATDLPIKDIDQSYGDVTWRKNENIRFSRFSDFKKRLYKNYKNKEGMLTDYEKVKTVLKSSGFIIDSARKTLDTSDGGSWYIVNDVWTNNDEFIMVEGNEFDANNSSDSITNTMTITDLGTVKEIVDFEDKIENVLDVYNVNFKKQQVAKYGSSEAKVNYAIGVFVSVSANNQLPFLYTYYPNLGDKNIKRQLLTISHQAGEDGFIYYEKNGTKNNITLLFTSDDSLTCEDLKSKSISKTEAKEIVSILKNSYLVDDRTGKPSININGDKTRQFYDGEIDNLNLEKCIINSK